MQTWGALMMACWRSVDRTLRQWRERARERTALAGLNERELRDIGIAPHDARREIEKPFWRGVSGRSRNSTESCRFGADFSNSRARTEVLARLPSPK
jgi:uncharacterized protein YjiS (DUF1127 family)